MCTLADACDFKNHGEANAFPGDGDCLFPNAVTRVYFERGSFLFHQGDPVRGGYHLTAGLVALERVDAEGRLVILKVMRPPALFPCADLFAAMPHGSTARALTATQACFIPAERVLGAMAETRSRTALLRISAAEAREAENTIFRLCAGDLAEQIVATLEAVMDALPAEDGVTRGVLPLCWRELAAMVGTSPEVLSRTLRRLERAGRLNVKGRAISLYDRERRRALEH